MHELIQDLVEAENKARRIVEGAREEGAQMVADARKRAGILVEDARRDARMKCSQIVTKAVEAARLEKEHRLEEARAAIQQKKQFESQDMERWVAAVVRCVCGL